MFVVLGFGAVFAGLISHVPQLVWFSEHKLIVFSFAAAMLVMAGVMQWRSRVQACPADVQMAQACASARRWSKITYFISLGLYIVGIGFAFAAPALFG
ncbi:MAG: hypothetical protein AB7N80_13445 [Bdellovibrionales bacterium]